MPSFNPVQAFNFQSVPSRSASVAFGLAQNQHQEFFPRPVQTPVSPLSDSSHSGYDSPVPFAGYEAPHTPPTPQFVASYTPSSPVLSKLTFAPSNPPSSVQANANTGKTMKQTTTKRSKPYERPSSVPLPVSVVKPTIQTSQTTTNTYEDENTVTCGVYTKAERKAKIARFREKWLKAFPGWKPGQKRGIVYQDRKKFAESRPRVGGRFIKGERKSDKIKAEKAAQAKAKREQKQAEKEREKEMKTQAKHTPTPHTHSLPSLPVPTQQQPVFDRTKLSAMDVSDNTPKHTQQTQPQTYRTLTQAHAHAQQQLQVQTHMFSPVSLSASQSVSLSQFPMTQVKQEYKQDTPHMSDFAFAQSTSTQTEQAHTLPLPEPGFEFGLSAFDYTHDTDTNTDMQTNTSEFEFADTPFSPSFSRTHSLSVPYTYEQQAHTDSFSFPILA